MSAVESHLGYTFKDKSLLNRALTHTSAGDKSYERLEFLGDRVLSFIIADMLYATFPDESEGDLAKRQSALVKQGTLTKIAQDMGLQSQIKMSSKESKITESILSDVVESIIGAMYLDGGISHAEQFIRTTWRALIASSATPPEDFKSKLQEFAQGKGVALPKYTVVELQGPDHEPVFTIEVKLADYPPQRATAASKQSAEKMAAQLLLEVIEKNG